MIIFVLHCPLNANILLFLSQHWSSIGQSTLVTNWFWLTLNYPLKDISSSVTEPLLGQSFDVASPNPSTKCYTVGSSNFTRSTFTRPVFNCTLLFNLRNVIFDISKRSLCYTRYRTWRSLVVVPKMQSN